jgi:ribosomal protein S16
MKHDRIEHWRSKGAQLSGRVEKLVAKGAAATPAA